MWWWFGTRRAAARAGRSVFKIHWLLHAWPTAQQYRNSTTFWLTERLTPQEELLLVLRHPLTHRCMTSAWAVELSNGHDRHRKILKKLLNSWTSWQDPTHKNLLMCERILVKQNASLTLTMKNFRSQVSFCMAFQACKRNVLFKTVGSYLVDTQ